MLEDPPTRAGALRRVFGEFYLSRPSCARLFSSHKWFSSPHHLMGLPADVILRKAFGSDKTLLPTSNDRPMKHFLVTSWPVIFYLFLLHWSVSPPSTAPRCQNQTSPTISRQQQDPSIGAARKIVCASKITECRKGGTGEIHRRPAVVRVSARVGGSSSILYGSTHFRVSAKMPLLFGRVAGNLFAKRFPGLLFFGTLFCRSKRKYTQSRTIKPQQYHYTTKPKRFSSTISR